MDRATSSPQGTPPRGPSPHTGPDPQPHPGPPTPRGADLVAATAYTQTIRHFFPDLSEWLDNLPDSRDQSVITYSTRFLAWVGIFLFLVQAGSRRKLKTILDSNYPHALDNLNRLAGTQHSTLPAHDTLHYFLKHTTTGALADLRQQMVHRLIRMKTLDHARLLGRAVVLVDGTGLYTFRARHCDACLERKGKTTTTYQHHALEAKVVGPAGVVVSIATAFIENADANRQLTGDALKQDCELTAFHRLAAQLKADFPQLAIVLGGDALFACGSVFQTARANGWSYVFTFKSGRLPSVWSEFERLKPLCPENSRTLRTPTNHVQVYRWVRDLSYVDDQNRTWTFHAVECTETSPSGAAQHFAWITDLPVTAENVIAIATKGGRARWMIENEAFNRQKNHGPNLEHAYSTDPEVWKAYYYLLQIAFILTQLVERGSLLRQLANELGIPPRALFGSLTNIVTRLREAFRLLHWPDECFDETAARRRRIKLADTS